MTEARFKLVVTEPVDTPPGRVYLDYYRLSEAPFSITPDPGFLFSASCHQEVLDKIGYAIDGRMGFVLLTGEVGTGKTTLCRTLLDRLNREAETVYVINPSLTGDELLASILEDLGATPPPQAGKKALIDQLNQRLLAKCADRPCVVIIDDAQTMTPEALEDLRLLSNLETDKRKLIQVVLSGQPELLGILSDDRLRQLKQRIAVHCRLNPLSVEETGAYISRRLSVAGNIGQVCFSDTAARMIHKRSGGIPRLINKICDFSLTAGYVNDAPVIGPGHVKRALAELDLHVTRHGSRAQRSRLSVAAMILVLIAVLLLALRPGTSPPAPSIQARPAAIEEAAASSPSSRPLDSDALNPDALPPVAKDGTLTLNTDTETVGKNPVEPQPALPAPFALQLSSFRTQDRAKRSVAQFRQKKIPAHWQMVAGGQWYRVVAGKFESLDQAIHYQTDHGLKKSQVIRAPWTVRVLPGQPDLSDADILRLVSETGYDSLMETGPAGDNEIYTGLFGSVEDAAITAERINSHGRILAQVVAR